MINGKKMKPFESENVFLAISLPEMSSSEVCVKYVETNLMKVAKIISTMTLISILIYEFYKKNKKERYNKEEKS